MTTTHNDLTLKRTIIVILCVYVLGARGVIHDVSSSIGSTQLLPCTIVSPRDSTVEHIVQWQKAGVEVPIFIKFNGIAPHIDLNYAGRLELQADQASIKLSNIRDSDRGLYTCKVILLDRPEDQRQNDTIYNLTIQSPPRITSASPHTIWHKVGDTVTLFCMASGSPAPSIRWMRKGTPLTSDGRITVNGNQVQIQGISRKDGGSYSCVFENRFPSSPNTPNTISKTINLVIEGGAYIMEPPSNTTVEERQQIRLRCQAEAYPNNITYRWFKDGQDVCITKAFCKRVNIYGDGSLVISLVLKEDTGWYKCRATNGLGTSPEASAYLNVIYKPIVYNDIPRYLYFPKGMTDSIPCPVQANPPVTQVDWHKDDHKLDTKSDRRLILTEDWALAINNIQEKDAGRYFCTPRNSLGVGKSSNYVQVIVRDPPYFKIRPKPYYQQTVGKSITFPCVAEGTPIPSVTWHKVNGQFSSTRTSQHLGNLTITNLVKSDHDTYECVAQNKVTTVVTSTSLIIEVTTPHAPENITVATTQFSATVAWKPAYDGGFPQEYSLRYKRMGEIQESWQTLQVIPRDSTEFTVYNLSPESNYAFMVQSRNKLGVGMYSTVIQAATKGYVPGLSLPTDRHGTLYIPNIITRLGPQPSEPVNISAIIVENSVAISWDSPSNTTVTISCYAIEYLTKTGWVQYSRPVLANATSILIADNKVKSAYKVRVFSYTPTSFSRPSIAVMIIKPQASIVSNMLSTGAIAGIVGGVVLFLIILMIGLISIKLCSKNRHKDQHQKYGNMQYYAGHQVGKASPNNNQRNEKWDWEGGDGFSRVSGMNNEIFTLPTPYAEYSKDNLIAAEKWNRPKDKNIFDRNFVGYETDKVRKVSRTPQYAVEIDFTRPIGRISRAADGRFVASRNIEDGQPYSPHNVNDIITSPNVYYTDRPGPGVYTGRHSYSYHDDSQSQLLGSPYVYRYPAYSESVSRSQSVPVTEYSGGDDDASSSRSHSVPPDTYVPIRYYNRPAPRDTLQYRGVYHNMGYSRDYSRYEPQTQTVNRGHQYRVTTPEPRQTYTLRPHSPPGGQRYTQEQDSDQGSFHSIASDHGPMTIQHGPVVKPLVRHSTAKPYRPDRTYMTSSPDNEVKVKPFHFDTDLSSVDPSSNATSRSKGTLPSGSTLPSNASKMTIPSRSTLPSDNSSRYTLPSSSSLFNGYKVRGSYSDHGRPSPVFELSSIPHMERSALPEHPYPRVLTPTRDRHLARITPSPKHLRVDEEHSVGNGSDSSGSPIGYSRDRLQGAVERVRRRTAAASDPPPPRPPQPTSYVPPSTFRPMSGDSSNNSRTNIVMPATYEHNVAPYKDVPASRISVASSGRGSSKPASLTQSRPELSRIVDEHSQENGSNSSGVGSRNTSQSNASSRGRINSSMSSSNTPHDVSTDSILNETDLAAKTRHSNNSIHKRDASGDENYEFDSVSGLESELLDALRNYSSHPEVRKKAGTPQGVKPKSATPNINTNTVGDVTGTEILSPGGSKQDERCAKLREEYQQFRREMQLHDSQHSSIWEEAESEML